jgi:hypothetical protein
MTCVLALLAYPTLTLCPRDLTLVFVAYLGQNLPFGYRFILIAPILEGILGGMFLPIMTKQTYHNWPFQEYPLERLLDTPI